MKRKLYSIARFIFLPLFLLYFSTPASAQSIITNGSFEEIQDPDARGIPFKDWSGWNWQEGRYEVGHIAHTGSHSALLRSTGANPSIALWYSTATNIQPARYRVTAYIAGYSVAPGLWGRQLFLYLGETIYNSIKREPLGGQR